MNIELIQRRIKVLGSVIFGRKQFQKAFEILYRISLAGMNIGGGSLLKDSGEKNALMYIARYYGDKKNLILFDVGANIGKYTGMLYRVFGAKSMIYAFEPSKETFNTLNKNVQNMNNVMTFKIGLGRSNSIVTLYTDKERSGIASVYKRRLDHFNTIFNILEQIELTNIDSFCIKEKVNHIHLLKLVS